jgi:hypothetical protein
MAPSPHLLWVNSCPTNKTTEAQWKQWYTEEHIPDLVNHHASTRASLYIETHEYPGAPKEAKNEKKFLALYQSDFAEPLKSEEYTGIRTTSEILPGKMIHGAGDFNARNYDLIQDYDPNNIGEGLFLFCPSAWIPRAENPKWHRVSSSLRKCNQWTRKTGIDGIAKNISTC